MPIRGSKNFLLVILLSLVAGNFAIAKSNNDSDQLDEQDRQEFNLRIERANSCTQSRDFACAEQLLGQAKGYVNGSRDRSVLQKAMESLELQRQLALRDDAKHKYAGERETVNSNAANAERELVELKRQGRLADNETARRAETERERANQANLRRESSQRVEKNDFADSLRVLGDLQTMSNNHVAEINRRAAADAAAKARAREEADERAGQRRRDDERDKNARVASADAQRERDKRAEQAQAREHEQRRQREAEVAAAKQAREQEQARLLAAKNEAPKNKIIVGEGSSELCFSRATSEKQAEVNASNIASDNCRALGKNWHFNGVKFGGYMGCTPCGGGEKGNFKCKVTQATYSCEYR